MEGAYVNQGYGEITIQKDLDGFTITFPIGTFPLIQTGEKQFQMLTINTTNNIDPKTVPELLLDFNFNEKGICSGISIAMEPKLAPIQFLKN